MRPQCRHALCVQEVHGLWEEVQEELRQKKVRTEELEVRLTQSEAQTTEQVRRSRTPAFL